MLGVKKEKSIKMFKELETYDLIEDVRQGRGKPNRIYVKKVADTTNSMKSKNQTSKTQMSGKQTSGLLKNLPVEVGKTDRNYNNVINIDLSDNNLSDQFERIDDVISLYSEKYDLPFQNVLGVYDRCSWEYAKGKIKKGFMQYFEISLTNEKKDFKLTKFIQPCSDVFDDE